MRLRRRRRHDDPTVLDLVLVLGAVGYLTTPAGLAAFKRQCAEARELLELATGRGVDSHSPTKSDRRDGHDEG